MTARPEVVLLLADVDLLPRIAAAKYLDGAAVGDMIRQAQHRDGRPVTEAEADLIGSATPEDLEAVAAYMAAQSQLANDQLRDSDRFVALVMPAWAAMPGALLGAVLDALPPDQRAEAVDLAGRMWPDGYLYPGGSGPRL